MPIRKIAEIKLKAGPYGRLEAVGSGFKFYSYDKDSAAIDFYFREQNGSPTDILGCTTELVLLTKEDGQQKKLTIIDSEVEIISALKGHARYVIPDRLRGYVGLVQGYVYLNFPDESRTDECRFDFTIERSLIEEEFENGGDYYIKDIQVIFDEVKDTLNSKIPEMQTKYDDLVKTFTDYANEKIAEYDSRFVTLNSNFLTLQDSLTTAQNKVTTLEQSIATANTNLNNRINEINKKIDDNDVFTKQESSANVIYQLIGKEKVRITLTLDFKNKIAGSDIENPNAASARSSSTLLNPSSFTLDGNVNYPKLGSLDGETLNVDGNLTTGFQIQMLSKFNILETLKRELGERFFTSQGAESIESQIALIKKILVSSTYHVWGYGSNPNGNKLSVVWWMDSQQYDQGVRANNTNTIREITRTLISASPRTISDDGCSYVLAYAGPSDGSTLSRLSIDYSSLDIELEISANDYFTSVIAANQVESIATGEEAEAGESNSVFMTPNLVFKAIAKWVQGKFVSTTGNETILGTKNFQDGIQVKGNLPVLTKSVNDYASVDKNNNASVISDGSMKLYRRGDIVYLTGSFKLSAAKYNQAVWFNVPSWAAPIDRPRMYWSSGSNFYLLAFDPSTINNIICIDNVAQDTWLTGSFCWLARDPY